MFYLELVKLLYAVRSMYTDVSFGGMLLTSCKTLILYIIVNYLTPTYCRDLKFTRSPGTRSLKREMKKAKKKKLLLFPHRFFFFFVFWFTCLRINYKIDRIHTLLSIYLFVFHRLLLREERKTREENTIIKLKTHSIVIYAYTKHVIYLFICTRVELNSIFCLNKCDAKFNEN